VKVARRKKSVEVDGASFVISPLTYSQIEEHALRSKAWNDTPSEKRDRKVLRDLALWVVCCGLNNASEGGPGAPDALSEADLANEMDDILAGRLIREIFDFSGVKTTEPSEEEAKKVEAAAGESLASS